MTSWLSTHRWMPDTRAGKVGLFAGFVFVVLGLGLALTAVLMDWNAMRGPVAHILSVKLGRPVRIDGNVHVRVFSLTPTISIGGLDIGNPAWAGTGSMAHAERVTLQIKLLPIFKSSLTLPSIRIEHPEMHLLRDTDGRVNWALTRDGRSREGGLNLPVIQSFEMQPGLVTFEDRKRELEFKGTVSATETPAAPTAGESSRPFRLVGQGTMNDSPFQFTMRGAPLVNVRRDQAYPFDLDLVADTTHLTAHGVLPKPFDLSFVDADFEMAGGDLADVYYISGIVFPNTRTYHVTGHFARIGTLTKLQKLSGTVGDSDMRGDISVQTNGVRPMLTANVSSQSLDLDDAATWFGGGPRRHKGDKAAKEGAAPPPTPANGRIFPDAQLRVARVRSMDSQVAYEAATVHSEHLPIRALAMHLKMEGGVLRFDSVSLALPEGKIDGSVLLDAREDIAKTALDARLLGVQLRQFKSKKSSDAPFQGVLRGRVRLEGPGNSVHQFMSASDGTATFVVPHGEVSDSLAELSGINVSSALGLMFKKDDNKASIRCGVANLKATHGTLQVQNLVFNTDNVLITGKGDVRLEDEQYDLTLHGQPKKLRLLRLKSPISIRGPLNKPVVGVEVDTRGITQSGVALALGALVTPLAAVVMFVDPGLAKDADCASLLDEAKTADAR